jgi:hypothetical protein
MGQTFSTSTTTGILLSSASENPATIAMGVYVGNTGGTLAAGVVGDTYAWTVANYGTVAGVYKAPGTLGTGIELNAGGTVINGSSNTTSALITAPFTGVVIQGGAGDVVNYGTIVGEVVLHSGGTVYNLGTLTSNAAGIAITGGGTVVNSGDIYGFSGIAFTTNGGSTAANEGFVSNSGIISTSQTGVVLTQGSTLANSGTITGAIGVNASGVITNSRLIDGQSGNGVDLSGGNLTNTGTIKGSQSAIYVAIGSGTAGATVSNYALLTGKTGIGISGTANNTIFNFGTIVGTGGTAVALGGGNDRLVIEAASLLQGVVAGFHPGDTFDLPFLSFDSQGQATLVSNGTVTNQLQIIENSGSFSLNLDPTQSFTSDIFTLSSDTNGDTLVSEQVTCYRRGTLILTAAGEVPVEDLLIGDLVVTRTGARRPIKWIGRRSYAGRFTFGRKSILPICVAAGALAEGLPRRDLWISPNHALYLEGVLIEARDLVNGVSIFQASSVESVEYFHIELAEHDLLVAEGVLAESYIDDDNRALFHNATEYHSLYPAEQVKAPRYCAARLAEGNAVERARIAIARQAGLPVPPQYKVVASHIL